MVVKKRSFPIIILFTLPILVAWVFLPQLANSFSIKLHVASAGALMLALALMFQRSEIALPGGLIGAAMGLWAASMLLSTALATNTYLATSTLLAITAMVILVLCLFNLPDLGTAQHSLETSLLAAGGGVALFALKQYLLPGMLDPEFHALGKMKIYSTLGNPTLASLVILAALPSSFWRAWRTGGSTRWLYGVLTLLLLSGLFVTQSRNVWGAVITMAVVGLIWLGSGQTRKRVLRGLLMLAAFAIVAGLFITCPPELQHGIRGRIFIWLTTIAMMLDHPLSGVGTGLYGLFHMDYQARLFDSGLYQVYANNAAVISEGHNEFMNWGATTGIAGLVGFTALSLGLLRQGWQSNRLREKAPQFFLAYVGYLFTMLFVAVTAYPATIFFFWLLYGMVLAHSQEKRLPVLTGGARHAAKLFLLALLLLVLYGAWKEIRSGWHEARGDTALAQHDAWLAQQEYITAIRWDSHNGELRKKLATSLYLDQQLQGALDELSAARRDSGDLGIQLLEGEVLARHGDLVQAEAVYRHIAAAFPNMVGAHFILGQIYLLQGKNELSTQEFRKVLDIQPSPYNLNMTSEKVLLQKRIVREYLRVGPSAP
ncbi:MAG TPA: O-antigen ligase family protein [Gallionellaceae bacterium]